MATNDLYREIGEVVSQFPLLHCMECASTLKQWLQKRHIQGKLWKISTQYGGDFILSARLERQECYDSITENGTHYGVEVAGLIFDNISRYGLRKDDWINDFTASPDGFEVTIIEEF